jgi:hypothetical protein
LDGLNELGHLVVEVGNGSVKIGVWVGHSLSSCSDNDGKLQM